jgi:DNA (cytosine-5)-methyltransferase 1
MSEITLPEHPGPPVLVSLFDGIGGFPEAFRRVGVRTAVIVEIDKQAAGVAAGHFPDAAHFADIRKVTGADLLAAGFDPRTGRISAGFPCQDLSLAGRRAGLDGARSGLYFEIMRLVDEIQQLTGVRPRWLVLENVPGLLSSVCPCPGGGICGKRNTACANGPHTVPGGACGRRRGGDRGRCVEIHGGAMGAVLGELAQRGYGYAYRVLDAQHFGVPQRRRRVVIVANSRDWHAPAEVLLEPQSSGGDSAPGRAQAARTARVLARSAALAGGGGTAPTIQGGGRRGYRVDAETAAGGGLVPETAATIVARNAKGSPTSSGDGFTLVGTAGSLTTAQGGPDENRAAVGHIIPFNEVQITHPENRSRPEPGDPSPTLDPSGRMDVAYALRRDPGGTGQGHNTNCVVGEPQVYQGQGGNVGPMGTLRAGEGTVQSGVPFTTLPAEAYIVDKERGRANPDGITVEATDVSPTITADGDPAERTDRGLRIVQSRTGNDGSPGDEVQNPAPIAFATTLLDNPRKDGQAPPIRANVNGQGTGSGASMMTLQAASVRRLTPVECERLQGYPDNWTAHCRVLRLEGNRWVRADPDALFGAEQTDSPRYRQLGNSIAVPVFEWVALGIQEYDDAKESADA